MNEANTNKLNADFPRLFPRPFYFECGDGWFNLIYTTCADIEQECEKLGLTEADWPEVMQCSTKDGTLRFYIHSDIESLYSISDAAEGKSANINAN